MKMWIISEIKRRIQKFPTPSTVYQKGVVDGLTDAIKIVDSSFEPSVALTKRQKEIHEFYELHGVFSRIEQWKSQGLSTYAITDKLNLQGIPTFHRKSWSQTQVQRVIKMMDTRQNVETDGSAG